MATGQSLSFQSRPRVGAGFTIFTYAGQPLVFCQQVAHQSPQPVGGGFSAIHPMDEPYPAAFVTTVAAGAGQMVLNMFELFGKGGKSSKIWDRLGVPLGGTSLSNPFGSTQSSNASIYLNTGDQESGIFKNAADIVDIYIQQAQFDPEATNIVKYIRPLGTAAGGFEPYFETYHGCIITNVVDNEQIEVGTLEIIKQISIAYRYVTRNGSASEGYKFRDSALSP